MPNLLSWLGPLGYNPSGVTPPDTVEYDVGCRHTGTGTCVQIADSWLAGGRRLPGLIAASGLTSVGDVYLGAYSAGGSIAKRLVEDPRDRARVRVMHLADATYTSEWEDASARRPPPIEGFVQYALEAAQGRCLLVATASPVPNGSWATGNENLQRLREEVEARSGRNFETVSLPLTPAPSVAYQLGSVILAEYPYTPLSHNHQTLAPQVWSEIVMPWLSTPRGGGAGPLVAGVGAVLGFLAGRLL